MPRSPLDDLALVPVGSLVLHEAVEPARAARVRSQLARAGVLADPVAVTPGPAGTWLVLDGAHRSTALAELGCAVALVQRMALGGGATESARVAAWAHDLPPAAAHRLTEIAAGTTGDAVVAEIEIDGPDRDGRTSFASMPAGAGRLAVRAQSSLDGRLPVMWALAGSYRALPYSRSRPADPRPRGPGVRVTWQPPVSGDLTELARRGATFPAGVSRFVLPGRVLGVRVPLADLRELPLSGGAGTDGTDGAGAARLLERLRSATVRHYREPVWVVDEGSATDEAGTTPR